MQFQDYQQRAMQTDLYPNAPALHALIVRALGLISEAGEVAALLKRVYRDRDGLWLEADKEKLQAELGDVLWYLATIAHAAGLDLEGVAVANLAKLARRQAAGTLRGEGDNR